MAKGNNIVSIDAARRRAVCDRYGKLDDLVRAFGPTKTEHAALYKEMQGWADADKLAAEETTSYEGSEYRVHVGMRAEEGQFSVPAKKSIWKLLKTSKSWKLFAITQKAVSAELGEEVMTAHLTRARTGSRKITAVAIAPAEAA